MHESALGTMISLVPGLSVSQVSKLIGMGGVERPGGEGGGVLPYKGLMGTCGQPGYVFRDFCLKQGIEFIIFCLNQGIDLPIFVLNRMSFLGR